MSMKRIETEEQKWTEQRFNYYFSPLAISLLHKKPEWQLGPQVYHHERQMVSIFVPFWTYKRQLSDIIAIITVVDNTIVAATLLKLIQGIGKNTKLVHPWLAVKYPSLGYGKDLTEFKINLLQQMTNQLGITMNIIIVDENKSQLEKDQLSSETIRSQRTKWQKLFNKLPPVITPDNTPTSTGNPFTEPLVWSNHLLTERSLRKPLESNYIAQLIRNHLR